MRLCWQGRKVLIAVACASLVALLLLSGCGLRDLGSMAKMDFADVEQVRVASSEAVRQSLFSETRTDPYATIEDRDTVVSFVEALSSVMYLRRERLKPPGDYYSVWLRSSSGRNYGLGYWKSENIIVDLHTFNCYQASPEVADFIHHLIDETVTQPP